MWKKASKNIKVFPPQIHTRVSVCVWAYRSRVHNRAKVIKITKAIDHDIQVKAE